VRSQTIRSLKEWSLSKIDFNTVFLEKHDLSEVIREDEDEKCAALLDILSKTQGKTLIYAGTYKNIEKISNLILKTQPNNQSYILKEFSSWLKQNYDSNWKLAKLLEKEWVYIMVDYTAPSASYR
jgi:hypothetical protein